MLQRAFIALIALICLCTSTAFGQQSFRARVLSVTDGDTCRVERISNGREYRLRLFGVDAPESDQPFGQQARNVLNELIDDQEIRVRLTGDQTYGRDVARIYRDGTYVNRELIADGWAWHYDRYTEGDEAEQFNELQATAREEQSGLWADANPINPSCWRRGDRDGDCLPDAGPIEPLAASRSSRATRFGPLNEGADAERAVERLLTPVQKFKAFMSASDGGDRTGRRLSARSANDSATTGHTIYGKPREDADRFEFTPSGFNAPVRGITELKRTAFTIGHHDRYRLPAWVAMRWSKQDFDRGVGVSMPRPSPQVDNELPNYARGGTSFEHAQTGLQRGHMARDDDMESFGATAVREAMKMSNMVPQLQGRNHAVWTLLEEEHKAIVAEEDDEFEIDTIWIIAGPIFRADSPVRNVGSPGTRVPDATYKVIAWFNADGEFIARAYVIDQLADSVELAGYLVPIDEVEEATGLNFFSELSDGEEEALEAVVPSTQWE